MRRDGVSAWSTGLALVLAGTAGCADRVSVFSPPTGAARLDLVLAADAAPLAREVTWLRMDATRPGTDWSVEGTTPILRGEPASGAQMVVLLGKGERSLTAPGRFDPRAFDRVELDLVAPRGAFVTVRFLADGTEHLASRRTWHAPTSVPRRLGIDLPRTARLALFDRMRIDFESAGLVAFAALELRSVPLDARLPLADDGARLVWLGGEARRAVGLTSGRDLEALVPLDRGGALTFSYGLPASLALPGRALPPRLSVTVRDAAGREVRHEVALEPEALAAERWASVRLSLDGLRGPEGRARLELRSPDDRPVLLAVAEPFVAGREDAATVLLVTSDTHRYDHVASSSGGVVLETPTLDALAERGVTYDDCFASTNTTRASHVTILTGLHPRDSGVRSNFAPLGPGPPTLAEAFAAGGFRTWAVVSARHLGEAGSGLGRGFDRVSIPPDPEALQRSAADSIDRLLAWLPEGDGAPLFLWLHLFDAHTPYEPPGEWDRRYYPADVDPRSPEHPGGVPETLYLPGVRDPAFAPAQYRAEISYLDRQLARVLERERLRAAIVCVTADHGESLGQHGIFYTHVGLYPDSLHVPLILTWPGAPFGTRVDAPVAHLDLARTLLDLAGVESAGVPGSSLLSGEPQAAAHFALAAGASSASITTDGRHLILYLDALEHRNMTTTRERHRTELFDLERDPGCERDLVDERPDVARALRARLLGWLRDAQPAEGEAIGLDPDALRRLEALGYTADPSTREVWIDPACECTWCARLGPP